MIDQTLTEAVKTAISAKEYGQVEVMLETPQDLSHGDYTTNVAFLLAKQAGTNPRAVAEELVAELNRAQLPDVETIKVAGSGFINFRLSADFLAGELATLIEKKKIILEPRVGSARLEMYENTGPNTNKPLHIGHLRNTALGVCIVNIRKMLGAQALSANINNDRGAHICKAMVGYLYRGRQGDEAQDHIPWRELLTDWANTPQAWLTPESAPGKQQKPDHFVGAYYVLGNSLEEQSETIKQAIAEMLQAWEQGDELVRRLWVTMNNWFYEGFRQTHARFLGIKPTDPQFAVEWYESELYQAGKDIILDNLDKGLFVKRDDGAIVAQLEAYNLPDKVALRSDGTAIYLTFDLQLAKQVIEHDKADLFAHVVANEQDLYFKQLFAIAEALGIAKQEQFRHISYGMILLKGGQKMSSREGTVVMADDLLDMVKARVQENFSDTADETAEQIAVGAVKYWMLKYNPKATIEFDIDKAASADGNSGPYLQYTYVRIQSLLEKAQDKGAGKDFSQEELDLVRVVRLAGNVVQTAGNLYAPNLLAAYLFDLAQAYNSFYQRYPILKAETDQAVANRLAISEAVAITLKQGLDLLGIQTPEKM